jgi:hypothetical protein
MNRNLFGTLVLLFCILLVILMTNCESPSERRGKEYKLNTPNPKIVLIEKFDSLKPTTNDFRVLQFLTIV